LSSLKILNYDNNPGCEFWRIDVKFNKYRI